MNPSYTDGLTLSREFFWSILPQERMSGAGVIFAVHSASGSDESHLVASIGAAKSKPLRSNDMRHVAHFGGTEQGLPSS